MKMGWKGEGYGLGKQQQGITRPLDVDLKNARFGLGFSYNDFESFVIDEQDKMETQDLVNNNYNSAVNSSNKFGKNNKPRRAGDCLVNTIKRLLNQYVNSPTESDLVFDKSLTKQDRQRIHKEAHILGLKTRSEGQNDQRFIVVYKKFTTAQLVESLMKNGGETSKYKLISNPFTTSTN